MKPYAMTIIAAALMLVAAANRAEANGYLMGRIITVHPYGAQDVVRNPALLATQEQGNSLGLFSNYQTYGSTRVTLQQAQITRYKLDIDYFNSGSAHISYARKIDIFAMGFDIYSNYESSNLNQRSLSMPAASSLTPGQGYSLKKASTNTFTAALGVNLYTDNFLGLQLNCTYYNDLESTKIIGLKIAPPSVYFHDSSSDHSEEVYSNPQIGYLGRIDKTEIGLLFSLGRLSWTKDTKEALSYDVSSLLKQGNFKAKGTRPYTFAYRSGPGLAAGVYSRPGYDVGMALEFEMTSPVKYNDSFLLRAEKLIPPFSNFMYFKSGSLGIRDRVSARPSFGVRGGLEYTLSRSALFNIGAGLIFNMSAAQINGIIPDPFLINFVNSSLFSAYGTTGIDFIIGKYSTFTIGTIVSYFKLTQLNSFKQIFATLNRELINSSLKLKTINIEIMASASIGF